MTRNLGNPIAAIDNGSASVITALEEQVDCYRRLAKLAQVQHEHVQQNQTEALLDVLRNRAELLDRIGKLELVIAPAKKAWSGFVGSLLADARQRAESLVSETKQLLEEITRCDRDDVMVLQQRKLNLGRQINQASSARSVNRQYTAAAYTKAPRMNVQH